MTCPQDRRIIGEVWKDIPGFEDQYEVSNFGRVYSKPRMVECGSRPPRRAGGRFLTANQPTPSHPYTQVMLARDGKPFPKDLRKLVWEAFRGPLPKNRIIRSRGLDPRSACLDDLYVDDVSYAPTPDAYSASTPRNDLPGEEWRDVAGYNGNYQVSSLGRVYSVPRMVTVARGRVSYVRGRFLKQRLGTHPRHSCGPTVSLRRGDGKTGSSPVRRLVLEAFVGPCPANHTPRTHDENDHLDCRLDNLYWDVKRPLRARVR